MKSITRHWNPKRIGNWIDWSSHTLGKKTFHGFASASLATFFPTTATKCKRDLVFWQPRHTSSASSAPGKLPTCSSESRPLKQFIAQLRPAKMPPRTHCDVPPESTFSSTHTPQCFPLALMSQQEAKEASHGEFAYLRALAHGKDLTSDLFLNDWSYQQVPTSHNKRIYAWLWLDL